MQSNHFSNISHRFRRAAVEFFYTFASLHHATRNQKGPNHLGFIDFQKNSEVPMNGIIIANTWLPLFNVYSLTIYSRGHSSEWPFFPRLGSACCCSRWATGPAVEPVVARQLSEAKNISKAVIARQLGSEPHPGCTLSQPRKQPCGGSAQLGRQRSWEHLGFVYPLPGQRHCISGADGAAIMKRYRDSKNSPRKQKMMPGLSA